MEHKVILIGKDGSQKTSIDELFDPTKENKHDYYFQRDIYPSDWFQQQEILFHPEKKLVNQLPEMATSGVIILLDLSYQDRDGNVHNGIQIATPPIAAITKEQKQTLQEQYMFLTDFPFDLVMADIIEEVDPLITTSFYDIPSFYQQLGIENEKQERRQR